MVLLLASRVLLSCSSCSFCAACMYASVWAIFCLLSASRALRLAILSRLYLYLVVGGGLKGRHDSLAFFLTFSSSKRVLLLVGFGTSTFSGAGGVSLRFLRGANESRSASSSSLLEEDMLAESELVTAGTPFLTMRLLELCELMPEKLVRVEQNDVLTAAFVSAEGTRAGAGMRGLEGTADEGISTASRGRILDGLSFNED
jgi:hypothetical protein